ncbi:PBSX family phage terminase large subunit [Nitrospinae bacterium]|nr:PBSX family phage terminase large subunit [Nitrospinota bacterium]|tara:strand:- start:2062 stop:3261 length:1200 start_codon:yes stop_codon:yes gene_type:complete
MIQTIQIPTAFEALLKPAPIKCYYGGRGGGKSTAFALSLLVLGMQTQKRILCTREIQGSIRDSVHKLLATCIEKNNLEKFYSVFRDSIRGKNGTEFIFHGLKHDPMQIKSLEGVDITWAEECQTIPAKSWSILTPTVLRAKGSELWLSLNPNLETDPTYQQFIVNQRPNQVTVKVNYDSNPFFTDELKAELEYQKEIDYEEYLHVWEGQCKKASQAQIFKNKSQVMDFTTPSDAVFYYGLDWGFSQDPTVVLRCFIYDNCLYIDHEAGGKQIELDSTHKLIDDIPMAKQHIIRADSARPESISFIRRQGYKIESVHKWSGSIEDGIEFIRSFRMVYIHSRCLKTAEEFVKYSYKVDRLTEDILPNIVDAHNHYIDALRYALQPMIKRKGQPKLARVIGA